METDDPEAGAQQDREESNVVRFPRDWLGPLDELVPFGPSADPPKLQEEAAGRLLDFPAPAPMRPDDFWGEGAAAIHHVLEGPTPTPAESAGKTDAGRSSTPQPRRQALPTRARGRAASEMPLWFGHGLHRRRGRRSVGRVLRNAWPGGLSLSVVRLPRQLRHGITTRGAGASAIAHERLRTGPWMVAPVLLCLAAIAAFVIGELSGTQPQRVSSGATAAGHSARLVAEAPSPTTSPATEPDRFRLPAQVPLRAGAEVRSAHTPAHADSHKAPTAGVTYVRASRKYAPPATPSSESESSTAETSSRSTTESTDTASSRTTSSGSTSSGSTSSGTGGGTVHASTRQTASGPVGPGAPFGPGHLG